MKKLFTVLAIMIASNALQAQITETKQPAIVTIGNNISGAYTNSELVYTINPNNAADTLYILSYYNYKYKTLRDIKTILFHEQGQTLTDLYTIMKGSFSDENKKNKDYRRTFNLGNTSVELGLTRNFGTTSLVFFTTDNGFCYLTEKQVDKLFGK